jgi:hypothetical protein
MSVRRSLAFARHRDTTNVPHKGRAMSRTPVHVIRLGLIKASIWKNQTKSGERHNVTVARLYKNGDTWKESSHFGRDDLLSLAKVADMAHTWILRPPSALEHAAGDGTSARGEWSDLTDCTSDVQCRS